MEIYDQIEDVVGVEDDKKKPVEKEEVVKELPKELPKEIQDSKQLDIPEKQSLLKSLTNFWADRSATLWDPLSYALESHEHTFADSDVIVREDEPSSLVAFVFLQMIINKRLKLYLKRLTVVNQSNKGMMMSNISINNNKKTNKNHKRINKSNNHNEKNKKNNKCSSSNSNHKMKKSPR